MEKKNSSEVRGSNISAAWGDTLEDDQILGCLRAASSSSITTTRYAGYISLSLLLRIKELKTMRLTILLSSIPETYKEKLLMKHGH